MAAPADGRGRRRDAASDHGDPAERPRETESAIRERLGVPSSAMEVVVVAESTHWDPDWLLRSEQYNRWLVRPALDRMLDALEAEPSRVFSLECTFFVDLYWQDRPERREQFRRLANDGRIHFTGSGVTTPDTLLPDEELIVRDLLLGQEWLRANGIDQEPRGVRRIGQPDRFLGHLADPRVPAMFAPVARCHVPALRRVAFKRLEPSTLGIGIEMQPEFEHQRALHRQHALEALDRMQRVPERRPLDPACHARLYRLAVPALEDDAGAAARRQ